MKTIATRCLQLEPVRDKDGKEIGEFQFQPGPANRALELIGKELGMFVDRQVISLEDMRKLPAEQLLALLAEYEQAQQQSSNPHAPGRRVSRRWTAGS